MAGIIRLGAAARRSASALALLAGQLAALLALTWWYGADLARLPDFTGDGTAVSVDHLRVDAGQVCVAGGVRLAQRATTPPIISA